MSISTTILNSMTRSMRPPIIPKLLADNSAHSSDIQQHIGCFRPTVGTSPETVYVDKSTLSGQTLPGYTVEDPWLQQHAVLRFYCTCAAS
mmetsp:Transcript_12947/g.21526  ORF Transcript_12947/g.21526 Transcript_12947/m.21526 type:complete len:90 (-) Transcript_12947:1551-1820(-)